MTKRLLSLALSVIFAVGIIPFGSINSVAAKDEAYSVSKALKYAKKNWDSGVGLCAEFASRCLQAGGVDVFEDRVINLYNELKDEHGEVYKLKLTNGTSGKIDMSENEGKLEKGDPIFYKCNHCGDFEHVVICNGENNEGYSQDYAHNKAHNGKKTTYTYGHCGGDSWTIYSIKMDKGIKKYGKRTSVGVPEIKSVNNDVSGIAIEWTAVEGADKYRIYRESKNGSLKKIGETKKLKFTDKTVKNSKKYIYVVRAVDGKKVSQYYKGKSITCIGIPAFVSADNVVSGVKIEWKKLSSVDGYYVYRKKSDGTWKRIAKVKGSKKVSYIDKSVKSGKSYQYTVRAYDGKVKGCYSKKGIKETFLSAPMKLTAKNSDLGIIINYPSVKGADKYYIYRQNNSGDWKKIATVKGVNNTSFVDLSVESGKTYCYMVKAVKGKYVSAFNSDGVKGKYISVINEVETTIPETTMPETTIPETTTPETSEEVTETIENIITEEVVA